MPVLAPGSKVLVTGANGFVAINIVDVLLKKGYSVRATIRSESKAPYLRKLFGKYGDKLEFVIVPDVAKVRLILSKSSWTSSSPTAISGGCFRQCSRWT